MTSTFTTTTLDVATHDITAVYTGTGDFLGTTSSPLSQAMTQATVTAVIAASNKVYDGTTAATLSEESLTGVIGTDSVSLTGGTATFSDKNVGTGRQVTATGLSLTGSAAANYVLASTTATTTANITPAGLAVSGVTAANKVYDASTAATLSTAGATLNGVFSGDTVTLGTSGATGTFASKDVKTGIPVSVAGLTISGAQAIDYSLTQPTGLTASITPAGLTVSGITVANKVYNASTAATLSTAGATLNGRVQRRYGHSRHQRRHRHLRLEECGDGDRGVGRRSDHQRGPGQRLLADPADRPHRQHHPRRFDGLGHHRRQQGLQRQHRGHPQHHRRHAQRACSAAIRSTLGTSGATGTFASKDVGTGIAVSVAGLTISGAQASDYTLTQPTPHRQHHPGRSDGLGHHGANKVYDASTAATLSTAGATLVGVFSGDTVTLGTSGATGTFASQNVGTGITVTVAGLTISGAQASRLHADPADRRRPTSPRPV